MNASCRQQVGIVKKITASWKKESTANEPSTCFSKETIEKPDIVCKTSYFGPENSASRLSKSLEFETKGLFSNGLKVSIEVSQVDSGINIGCSYNETFGPWNSNQKKHKEIPACSVTPVKNPFHISHRAHCVVNETKNSLLEPPLDDILKQTNTLTNNENVFIEEKSSKLISSSDSSKGFQRNCSDKNVCEGGSFSQNMNAPLKTKNVNEDNIFDKATSVLGFVTPIKMNCTETVEDKNYTCSFFTRDVNCSTPNDFKMTISDEEMKNTISEDLSINYNSNVGVGQRKRSCTESDEITSCKRLKTSDKVCPVSDKTKVILKQIQCLIDIRVQSFFNAFDQRMEELSKRVNLIEIKGNNSENIARWLKKVRKLESKVKTTLRDQKWVLPHNCSQSDGNCCNRDAASTTDTNLLASNEFHNMQASPPDFTNPKPACPASSQSVNPYSSGLDISSIDAIVPSDSNSELNSTPDGSQTKCVDIMDLQAQKNADTLAVNVESSIQRKSTNSPSEIKNTNTVIDLTTDEGLTCNQDIKIDEKCPSPDLPDQFQEAARFHLPTQKSLQMEEEETSPIPKHDVLWSNKVPDTQPQISKPLIPEKPHVPMALPKTSPEPNIEMQITRAPQQPELRLTQVQNPKGIALSWNVSNIDPNCAPAERYCLYVRQETPQSTKKQWQKIGEIKALPLPMACTLTQFVEGSKISFVMRAIDSCGRLGPLCDIQSTTLLPSTNSV
ncbi:hypothetical protein FKM82_003068 [Ascaphus truei]